MFDKCNNCVIPPHMQAAILKSGNKKAIASLVSPQMIDFRKARSEVILDHVSTKVNSLVPYLEKLGSVMSFEAKTKMIRQTYSAENGYDLPGPKLVREEGSKDCGDQEVDEAHNFSGIVHDFYLKVFERNSIDGKGLPLVSSVHVQDGFSNAFWNGEQMAYGDGDGPNGLFHPFTRALSVVGHELTHAVVQWNNGGGLDYYGQSGALNESAADCFGAMAEQFHNNQTVEKATWLCGAELFNNIQGDAIRNLKSPGSAYSDPVIGDDPQPNHMDRYVVTENDQGGVHINSGIINKFFYTACAEMGLKTKSWETMGQIWYHVLMNLNNSKATFEDWTNMAITTATLIHGKKSKQLEAVLVGAKTVGLIK